MSAAQALKTAVGQFVALLQRENGAGLADMLHVHNGSQLEQWKSVVSVKNVVSRCERHFLGY